ncbi:MAG TPA: 6,7-dimethyl-8-ribityllumazine synthase [Solirubrobacteraceae bacterium]|jgi:6,7-dimethyl-8-ribityllumazine synthase
MTSKNPTRIALVAASWHAEIVASGERALIAELAEHGVATDCVERFSVPGAFELPLLARRLARSGRYDAVVCTGLVIDGGIYRHEFVASAVIDGLMAVGLETDVPVLSMVLTPHHFHEHEAHAGFFAEHFELKGREVARACLQTIESLALV